MKIALITGGSRGLGKNMARHLAAKGTDLIFTYNSRKDEADKLVGEITATGRKAAALQLDVTKHGTFGAFAETVKQTLQENWNRADFDFLVNNAGMGMHASIMETTPEQFDLMVNAHLKAPFFLTQKLLPVMKDRYSSNTIRTCGIMFRRSTGP